MRWGERGREGSAGRTRFQHALTSSSLRLRKQTYLLGGLGSSMLVEIGHVEAIFRCPVKSMGGERLEVANLGWHGLEGDRRLASRRIDDRSGFPWLTASKLPDLLLFAPDRRENGADA
jgi:hypothetical protein